MREIVEKAARMARPKTTARRAAHAQAERQRKHYTELKRWKFQQERKRQEASHRSSQNHD
ncbi:hypothetical protein J7I98_36465 [Streptomyces sp. ISL-98]|uniref:hypothetical protein n=1 Tax=Streptomyces sp. ISL-98 TaxID=2819192 RepID=UPI001BEA3C39|nr:hypothetical protein [Streptomyces sp. ISL-98]MBT2511217.1 hypothetical protein [Streptomyces sp. ISL-98]